MKPYPDVPSGDAVPADLFEEGHLWIYEDVVGVPFRFQLTGSGTVRVGDHEQIYGVSEAPPSHQHAAHSVRECLDTETLRSAVDDVEAITFVGRATINRGIPYEWDRLPSFLGQEIWDDDRGQFLESGRVERIYRQLGLSPLNVIEREVNVRDFDPTAYEFPQSEWYDGPVAGVAIENKRGLRGHWSNPAVQMGAHSDHTSQESPITQADQVATADRLARVETALDQQGASFSFHTVRRQLFLLILREEYPTICEDPSSLDAEELRTALTDSVGEYLADEL